jgi:hypothetical protein
MASDVARLIVKYLQESKSLDCEELKDLFKQKKEQDAYDLRNNVKRQVSSYIKANVQPNKTSMVINVSTPGCVARYMRKLPHSNSEDMYTFSINDIEHIVTNLESKTLIKEAIVPLDLKWKVRNVDHYIEVSWSHWDTE